MIKIRRRSFLLLNHGSEIVGKACVSLWLLNHGSEIDGKAMGFIVFC